MAKRLKTRLSAGAALVTGLSALGIGMIATPAQAAPVTQDYECTYDVLNIGVVDGSPDVKVALDVQVPTSVEAGEEITSDVTATVTIPEDRRDSLYGLLGIRQVDGPNETDAAAEDGGLNSKQARNKASFALTDGTETVNGTIPLTVPKTPVPTTGELVVEASGAVAPVKADAAGTYSIDAGDFQAYIRGYGENGDYKTNITLDCTNVSADTSVATVEVTEGSDPEPTTSEPTTSEPTTSEPTGEPTTTEPTTTTTPTPPTDGGGTDGPETPDVVQTDGVGQPGGSNTAALLLGGALLAGAGAGSVVLVRRRQAAQH